jgi:regulator of replication initiation timing
LHFTLKLAKEFETDVIVNELKVSDDVVTTVKSVIENQRSDIDHLLTENRRLHQDVEALRNDLSKSRQENKEFRLETAEQLGEILHLLQGSNCHINSPGASSLRKRSCDSNNMVEASKKQCQQTPCSGTALTPSIRPEVHVVTTDTVQSTTASLLRWTKPFEIKEASEDVGVIIEGLLSHQWVYSTPSTMAKQRKQEILKVCAWMKTLLPKDTLEFATKESPPPGPERDAWNKTLEKTKILVTATVKEKVAQHFKTNKATRSLSSVYQAAVALKLL